MMKVDWCNITRGLKVEMVGWTGQIIEGGGVVLKDH